MGIGSCDRAQAVPGIKKNDSPSPKSHQLLITPHLELGIPYLLLIPYWDFVGLDLVLYLWYTVTVFVSLYIQLPYCMCIDVFL